MNPLPDPVREARQRERRRLAALPFADKVKILEQLRDRQLLLAANPLRKKSAS